ncbi:MAG TPA: Fic family protein [Streptosporangiaceae bacterium]|nr:Fic family protein [Streptosporangiaceae bacterium]
MLLTAPELDARELEVLADIEDLKRRLRHQLHEPRRWYGSLRRLSIARAIQGSNSIEGFDATLDDAAAVAVGEEPLDADQETRLALKGYRDAMTYVLQLADDEEFAYSTQVIKALHFMMTSYDLRNRPGRWRAGAVYVRNEETGQIVYEGPEIDQVPAFMQELVDNLNGPCHQRIIQAATGHLNLVMIHPFRDGNGRMARCLQSLVLARGGVLAPVFMSIEEYLGRNTQKYYDVLAEVGKGSWHPANDARPWVRFTLTAHLRQARTMLLRVRETERLWVSIEALLAERDLPDRVMPLLFDAALGLRVRNATYRASLEDAGEDSITEQTASRDLQRVVASGLLRPVGEKRGRFYAGGAELLQLRREIIESRGPGDDSDPFPN